MEDSDSDSDGSEEHRVSKTDSLNRFILRDMIITTLSRGYPGHVFLRPHRLPLKQIKKFL